MPTVKYLQVAAPSVSHWCLGFQPEVTLYMRAAPSGGVMEGRLRSHQGYQHAEEEGGQGVFQT